MRSVAMQWTPGERKRQRVMNSQRFSETAHRWRSVLNSSRPTGGDGRPVREILSDALLETVPSISGTKEDTPPQSPCGETLPSGKKCQGMVTWFPISSENPYSSCDPCTDHDVPWRLFRAFQSMHPDPGEALRLGSAIIERIKTPLVKTRENSDARDAFRRVLASEKPWPSVVALGPTGTGKTFLGLVCLHAMITQGGVSGLFLPEHVLIDAWRSTHDRLNPELSRWAAKILDRAKSCDILLLDDFGQTRNATGGALDEIESVIMSRHERNASIVVTSNRSLESLAHERGDRVVSRLCEMARGSVVTCGGGDWRINGKA
jgi:hypothetical protein